MAIKHTWKVGYKFIEYGTKRSWTICEINSTSGIVKCTSIDYPSETTIDWLNDHCYRVYDHTERLRECLKKFQPTFRLGDTVRIKPSVRTFGGLIGEISGIKLGDIAIIKLQNASSYTFRLNELIKVRT